MGGLSLGYYLCGKFSLWVRNQLKAYAVAEGIIGVWLFCFPGIFEAVESFTRYWRFSPPGLIILQGIFCSVILMGVPTICMGGTIPFLTRGLSRNVGESTRVHAKVYAVNTAGAFIGTLLAGFYLIPQYGLPLTIKGTAFLNMSACLFFWFVARSSWLAGRGLLPVDRGSSADEKQQPANNTQQTTNSPQLTTRYSPAVLCIIAFLSGFYVMTLENVLIRITNLSLGSSSYSFSLIVSVFILSIAIGSFMVGKLKEIPDHLLFSNQILITLSLLLVYVSLDTWPYWAHLIRAGVGSDMADFFAYYRNVFIALALVLVVPVGLMGATVPIAFHEIKRDLKNVGKHSGLLFSLNTFGNLTGSLIGGIFFYYFLNHAGVFLSAVLLSGLSACLAGWPINKRYFAPAAALTGALVVVAIFTPFYDEDHFMVGTFIQRGLLPYSSDSPDGFFQKWNSGRDLKFYKDGPTATVAVTEHPYPPNSPNAHKSRSIIVNGKSDSSTIADSYLLKLLAHLPALVSEKRERIMVIGLGAGVTAGELTLYPDAEHIEIAEISPVVVQALPHFRKFTYDLDNNPKVHIRIGDAFRILGRSRNTYNIILSEPSNPWVTGVDLLFTREFYKLVRTHLTQSGILAQWIHTYFADPQMLGMIINTVRQEFKECRMFMASPGDLILLASKKPLSIRNINQAENILNNNQRVRASLGDINLESVEAILIREIWPPTYISENFSGFGIQTMDNPRLHYMAGKTFFTGQGISDQYLFNSSSAEYFQDFLITKKYKNWQDFPFSKEMYESLINSLRDKYMGYYLPMARALRLKAYLGDPEQYPLSDKEKKAFGTEFIPFINHFPKDEDTWRKIHLNGSSSSEKAAVLSKHIRYFRNWIVPYPVDDRLKALL